MKADSWPAALRDQQLNIIGNGFYGALAILAIIVVALSVVTVRATLPGGASLSIGGDGEEDPGPTVTTTTTTRVDPPAKPESEESGDARPV